MYDEEQAYNYGTNICWGTTIVAPGGLVTIPSLTNLVGDFYSQTFTNHLERSLVRWEEFTRSKRLPVNSHLTLGAAIEKVWGSRR